MAEGRKGKTGLEWLMDERAPASAGGAAEPAPAPAPEPTDDLDDLLAGLDPKDTPAADRVVSRAPAELSLTLGSPKNGNHAPAAKRDGSRADAVANALAVAEAAMKEAAKATDDAADFVADALLDNDDEPAALSPAVRALLEDDDDAPKPKAPPAEPIPPPPQEAKKPDPVPAASTAGTPPKKSGYTGTRAHPRVLVRFEVRYKKGAEAVVAFAKNLSLGGFFVATNKFLPLSEIFQVQLVFADHGNRKMSVICEVIWSSAGDPDDLENFPAGMGCKFLDIDDKDLPFLAEVVEGAKDRPAP